MLKPIVAGNWKMNKTPKEGNSFISEVLEILSEIDKRHFQHPHEEFLNITESKS